MSKIQRAKQKAKAKAQPAPVDPPVVEQEVEEVKAAGEEETTPETEEKDYYDTYRPTYGATSFAALMAAREANEEAQVTENLADDLQSIVSNIFMDPSITDKAGAVTKASQEFGALVGTKKKKESPSPIESLVNGFRKLFRPKDSKGLTVYKDANGAWRWLGVNTNNFKDRDGDILTEAAHKDYLEYLDQNPDSAPVLCDWHILPTASKSRADFWDLVDGFVVFGGPLTDKEAGHLSTLKQKYELGMSHGFYILERDAKEHNVITRYRTFEVSHLPQKKAANAWTALDVIQKEAEMPFTPAKRKYLLDSGRTEEEIAELESTLAQGKEALDKIGVQSKESQAADKAEDANVEEGEESPELEETPGMKELIAGISKALGMNELSTLLKKQNDMLEKHDKELAALKQTDDEKIAKEITAPVAELWWIKENRPSQDETNKTEPDELENVEQAKKDEGVVPDWVAQMAPRLNS